MPWRSACNVLYYYIFFPKCWRLLCARSFGWCSWYQNYGSLTFYKFSPGFIKVACGSSHIKRQICSRAWCIGHNQDLLKCVCVGGGGVLFSSFSSNARKTNQTSLLVLAFLSARESSSYFITLGTCWRRKGTLVPKAGGGGGVVEALTPGCSRAWYLTASRIILILRRSENKRNSPVSSCALLLGKNQIDSRRKMKPILHFP